MISLQCFLDESCEVWSYLPTPQAADTSGWNASEHYAKTSYPFGNDLEYQAGGVRNLGSASIAVVGVLEWRRSGHIRGAQRVSGQRDNRGIRIPAACPDHCKYLGIP